nr:immunoglobulin light chain junction region [Macaca mulatta]
CQQGYSYPCSF